MKTWHVVTKRDGNRLIFKTEKAADSHMKRHLQTREEARVGIVEYRASSRVDVVWITL